MAAHRNSVTDKLEDRKKEDALRELKENQGMVDFSSNDYLGLANSEPIFQRAFELTLGEKGRLNGATGSRLLTGHYASLQNLESALASWQGFPAALVYNSGYSANLGFFSSVPLKSDWVLYDERCHASIRDGIRLGHARAFRFAHNDIAHLADKIAQLKKNNPGFEGRIYVVTESVFSMDGDSPDLAWLGHICREQQANLVVDEAHALGIYQNGLIAELGLQQEVFACIITFGKALGCHGAAVLGSGALRQFLINYSRSLIYSTAPAPHSIHTAALAINFLRSDEGLSRVNLLNGNRSTFVKAYTELGLSPYFKASNSAIQSCLLPGNSEVRKAADALQNSGYDVRPILSPTVATGAERLRFCLHSYNTEKEIYGVLQELKNHVLK